jgi:hypothetical protein
VEARNLNEQKNRLKINSVKAVSTGQRCMALKKFVSKKMKHGIEITLRKALLTEK